jgi:predicted phosphodiesterase
MNDKIVGRPIRVNKQVLKTPKGKDYAEVVFLGDVHYGSPQCDTNRFLGMVNYCVKNNIYVLLMGDLLETATRESVGAGVYEQDKIPQFQHEQMVDWLEPLAKKNLVLGALTGNHEERVYKSVGINLTKAMCRELGIKYLGDACWNTFKVGQEVYTIYSLHGRTGARLQGTTLNALERISPSFDCDMLAMGHAHKCINAITLKQKVQRGQVVEVKQHLLVTGHYLKYDGGYGQTLGLTISKMGSPKVKFFKSKHDILVTW